MTCKFPRCPKTYCASPKDCEMATRCIIAAQAAADGSKFQPLAAGSDAAALAAELNAADVERKIARGDVLAFATLESRDWPKDLKPIYDAVVGGDPLLPMESKIDCGAVAYQSQWRERLGWRLFPAAHADIPDLPGSKDGIICHVKCELSFWDRLRVLISGRIEVGVKTATEFPVGKTATNSSISVRPPDWLDRKPEGPRAPWLQRQ